MEKQLNPGVFWLDEEIKSEQLIARSRNDLDSFAKTLILDFLDKDKELKTNFYWLVKKIEDLNFTPKYCTSVAIVIFLNRKIRGLNLSNTFNKNAKDLLGKICNFTLTPQKYMEVYYYLSQADYKAFDIKRWVENFRDSSKEKGDIQFLLEADFALSRDVTTREYWEKIELDKFGTSLEKLAKLGILLKESGSKEVHIEKILRMVEEECQRNFKTMSLPTISLAIYEAERIINTNLPASKLDDILLKLQEGNLKWSKIIKSIKEDGATIDIDGLNGLPRLSLEDSFWALNLLLATSRRETYQLSEDQYSRFAEYTREIESGKLVTSRRTVFFFLLTNAVAIFISWLYVRDQITLSKIAPSLNFDYLKLFTIPTLVALGLLKINLDFWKSGKFDILAAIDSLLDRISK